MVEIAVQRGQRGALAETAALEYLHAQGLRAVMRNYRCRMGEIDLIMLDGMTLVFVEVRSRSHHRFGSPAESVNHRKQKKLLVTAQHFLLTHKQYAHTVQRFDIMSVTTKAEQPPHIEWIRNAFSTSN
ncbi:MAG: YraN family protein [Gammaproteobacteria bacterium]|nr:YraN family protein [Gammaproteobacteria bacterium]